jgi:hypothetical protein
MHIFSLKRNIVNEVPHYEDDHLKKYLNMSKDIIYSTIIQ